MKVNEKILRKTQTIIFNELLEVDRICKKYNIVYWLTDGTLLGAVRHKGFIPWDDDLDICMLSKDYDKFLKVAKKELKKDFFLDNFLTDNFVYFDHTRIRDRKSTFIHKEQENKEKFHQGIFMDIFVMDHFSLKVKRIYKLLHRLSQIKIKKEKNRFLILKIIILKLKLNKILSLFLKKDVKNSLIGYRFWYTQLYKAKDIFPLKEIEFEGYKFPCPNNTDIYLKELYGDTYMELPPEKERVGHAREIRLNEKCFFEKELERTGRKLYEE